MLLTAYLETVIARAAEYMAVCSGVDPESFERGWGSKTFDLFFCFSHYVLQRGRGVHTNIPRGQPLAK